MTANSSSRNAIRRATRAAIQLKKQRDKTRTACIEALQAYLKDKEGAVDLPLSLCKALQTLYFTNDSYFLPSLERFVAGIQENSTPSRFQLTDGRSARIELVGNHDDTWDIGLRALISS